MFSLSQSYDHSMRQMTSLMATKDIIMGLHTKSGIRTVRSSLPTLPDTNNDYGDQWKTGNRTVLDVSVKENR